VTISDQPGFGEDWGAAFRSSSLDGMTAYEESLVEPMFIPWAEYLLDQVDPMPGERLLDVATGPGTVARLAAVRVGAGGGVVGVDLSDAMLLIARGKPQLADAAPIEYRQSPAAPLDVPDSTFDVVTCQQGLQFFPDRAAATRELLRALRPGGRMGLAVWSTIDRNPVFDRLAAAIGDVFGEDAADRYRGGPWGLGDRRTLEALVSGAGFRDLRIEEVVRPARFAGGAPQLERSLAASVAMSDIATATPEVRRALRAAIASRLQPLTDPDGAVSSDLTSHIAAAVA
jgi:SAM-dependent methyltransferase